MKHTRHRLPTGRTSRFRPARALALAAFLTLVVGGTPGTATAQSCTPDQLRSADTEYVFGRFANSTSMLTGCLPGGFNIRSEKVQAWRLLALSHIAVDSLAQARIAVRSLLKVDSRFRPDPAVDPVQFVSLVSDIKPKWYTWPWTGRQWYHWVGRAAIVGTAISIPIVTKKEVIPLLPAAPGFPGQ